MYHLEYWKEKASLLWEWIKKNHIKCLVIVNIILLSYFAVCYVSKVSNLIELEFTQEQLQSYTEDKCVSGFVDNSREAGTYNIIPDMFLRKGHYSYTIYYEGNSPGSYCGPYTYQEYYNAMVDELVFFDEGKTEGTRTFWMNVDLNIVLRLCYNGEGSVKFTGFSIKETNVQAKIELFTQLLYLIGFNIIILLVNRKKKPIEKNLKYSIAAVIVIALIASSLSLTGGLMEGHDTRFHLARIEGIKEGILSGQFPVRISPIFYNGYGYANSIFYGELFLYFPAFLRLIGFTVIDSFNAYIIALNFFTALICFYCSRKMISDDMIAVTMALFYTLSPYRLMDLYSRSAIGEVTAMAFLPLIAYGVYYILTEECSSEKYKRAYLPLTLGLTGIIQSHILTVEMTAGFILLACALFFFKTLQKKRFFMLVKTVIVTFLLNVWFLVPFLDFTFTQKVRIFNNQTVNLIQKTGLFLPQLFSLFSDYSQLSFDASYGIASEMTYSMGLSVGVGIVLFITMLLVKNDEYKNVKRRGICFLVLAVIATWMTTLYFPWERISTTIGLAARLVSSLQFVWRFMGIASALAIFVTGFGLLLLKKQEGKNVLYAMVAILATLSMVSAMDYVQDNLFSRSHADITENSFIVEDNCYYAMYGEYNLLPVLHDVVSEIFEPRCFEGVEVVDYEKQRTNIVFSVKNNDTAGYVYLPLTNYKGYKVSSEDGVISNANLQTGEDAVMCINIPENYSGTISVSYNGFWYWRVAELITLITIVVLIFSCIRNFGVLSFVRGKQVSDFGD